MGRQTVRPGPNSRHACTSGSFSKRKSWSRYGVSDIIGNLLILAITVTLFTGVLYFVSSMPGPAEKVYTDFSSSVVLLNNAANDAYINVTHKGGEPLEDTKTNIYLFKDETPITYKIADGNIVGTSWPTGVTWSKLLTGITSATALSIMIVDVDANTVVYNAPLQGGSQAAMTYPIIADRGLTPTPAHDGEKVRFYAQISDPYGKLDKNSVYVNASVLGLSQAMPLVYNSTLNLFVSNQYTANLKWNGNTVLICASDVFAHRSTAPLTLSVTPNPSGTGNGPYKGYPDYLTNGTYPPDASGGEAGGSLGITFYYIRRTSDWTITRDFNTSEGVTIELWSDTLDNMAGQNSFFVYQPLLGVNPIYPPSSNTAFQIGDMFSTFRQFVYNFTAPADAYRYPLQMVLKDNLGNTFNVGDYINVSGSSYPQLKTYVASGNTLVETKYFNHTDDLYLVIKTKDVDRYTDTVYLSGIEVDDYTGSYVIMKSPTAVPAAGATIAYNAPLSSLYKTNGATTAGWGNNTNNGVYTLKITLKDANQGWWLPKTNSYTLKITTFFDTGTGGTTGESYSQLSCQFTVTAPLTTTDVAAAIGSGSFTWSSSGAEWSDNAISWFQGGDQWNERVIDDNPSSGPLGLYLADLTGDGRNDLVVGAQDTSLSNLFWYENSKSDGTMWSSARPITYPFDAYSGTQTAYSTDQYGNVNEDATVWKTSGTDTYYSGYSSENEMCTALSVADLNNDGRADVVASFIHVVVYTSATGTGDADYTNSYGMFFNRGVYVFWNDGSSNWVKTTLYSTDGWKTAASTTNQANGNGNPAAADLAIADFNLDGYNDIVGVYEDGSTKVWLNMWIKNAGSQSGAFSTSESLRTLTSVSGNLPWDHKQIMPKVRTGDMNGDRYPDIVRTSTLSSDQSVYIYYTHLVISAVPMDDPDYGYPVSSEYGATASSMTGKLLTADASYQTLTEKNVLFPAYNSTGVKTGADNTGSAIGNIWDNDGNNYNVGAGNTMSLGTFSLPFDNLTTPIDSSRLVVEYKVNPGYTGTGYFQYSFDGGATWTNTTIRPLASQTSDTTASFSLTAVGGSSYSNITSNLMVRFINPAGSSNVLIDYMWVEVNFIQTKAVGWIYQIPNAVAAYQLLTVNGHVSGSEGFRIEYSTDNETWFALGQITSTIDVTKSFNLTYTPNSFYYVRITDLDRAVTDVTSSVFSLDQLIVSHNSATVEWTGSASRVWISSSGPISGLAIGDMKKRLGVYVPNEPNDIVVATGGNTAATNKLLIIQQSTFGSFSAQSLDTAKLAIMCPSSGAYEIHGVDLGDLDGDQDLDIVLVVGAQTGRDPGSGPSLWEYTNNQQSGGVWKFTETPVSSVAARGESVINVTTGYIDLTILLPLLGMVAVVASSEAVGRWRGRKK
jgi:hypothetical protein